MSKPLPSHAQVVVIGGGVHGCSVAYHIANTVWKEVILLERKALTSRTTWHAAGLTGQLEGSYSTTAFASYGFEMLQEVKLKPAKTPAFANQVPSLSPSIKSGCPS